MHPSTIVLLLSSTALAVPAIPALQAREWTSSELGLHVTNLGYQGDGFYSAVFNESGVAEVKFTPLSQLDLDEPEAEAGVSVSADVLSGRDNNLNKRATICSGRWTNNQDDLDNANRALVDNAVNMPNQGGEGSWGWVHWGAATAFFCNYRTNFLTRRLITDMQAIITDKCGAGGYGNDRRINCCDANDLAVGKTFRGDNFCTPDFRG